MADITEKTHEFLRKCKQAGYQAVTIFIRDKRVPQTKKLVDGDWFGTGKANSPYKVVCGAPQRLGRHPEFGGTFWPKMWTVVRECGLVNGLYFGGFGLGDAHNINVLFCGDLTPGYYDLTENGG